MPSFIRSLLFRLFIIPCLFITNHICFPFSLPKLLRFIKITASHDDDDNDKREEGSYVVGKEELQTGLQRELMPRHVAVIMDGNRRWAERAGLMTSQGHKAGAERLIEFAELCFDLGIHTVSAFAFSAENWGRNKIEVKCIMSLIQYQLKSKIKYWHRKEI